MRRIMGVKGMKTQILSGHGKILFDELTEMRKKCHMQHRKIKSLGVRLQEARRFAEAKGANQDMLCKLTKPQRMLIQMQVTQSEKAPEVRIHSIM